MNSRPGRKISRRQLVFWIFLIITIHLATFRLTTLIISDQDSRSISWLVRLQASGKVPAGNDAGNEVLRRGSSAVPELARLLETPDSKGGSLYAKLYLRFPDFLADALPPGATASAIRGCAAFDLLFFGTNAAPALPALLACTQSTDPAEQNAAVEAIRSIGPQASSAIPRLRELLGSRDERLRMNAATALAALGAPPAELTSVLLKGLASTNIIILEESIQGLVHDERNGASILIQQLKDTNGWNAAMTVQALFSASDRMKTETLPGIMAAIHPNPQTASMAMNLLASTPPDPARNDNRAAILIHELATAPASSIGPELIFAVAKLGTNAHATIPLILPLIGNSRCRGAAEYALQQIGPGTADELPALLIGLKSADRLIRIYAIEMLNKATFDTHSAVPTLLVALNDPDSQVRRGAAEALYKACRDPDIVIPPMLRLLGDGDADVRMRAVRVISWFGPKSAAAQPQLIKALNDPASNTRRAAAWAIGALGPAAGNALPVIEGMLSHPNAERRVMAVNALCKLGPLAKDQIAKIVPLTKDSDTEVRLDAAWALWRIDQRAEIARPIVAAVLGSQACRDYWEDARRLLAEMDQAKSTANGE